jgi:hypothetical protein
MTYPYMPNQVAGDPGFKKLATAFAAVPLIEQWCKDVKQEVWKMVTEGKEIIGPDGNPYKFVEGKEGDRKWKDPIAAAVALELQIGPKAYTEPKVITAPAAAKILGKKKTELLWNDIFVPLITRPRGRAILTLGSDERPAFSGESTTDDLEDELSQ